MTIKSYPLPLFIFIVLALISLTDGAKADPLILDCEAKSFEAITCKVQINGIELPDTIEAQLGGLSIPGLRLSPYDSKAEGVFWNFLVDISNPKRQAAVDASADLIAALIAQGKPHYRYGLSTFAASTTQLVTPPADGQQVLDALKSMKAEGRFTHIFQSTIQAIEETAKIKAGRKAVVVISDGLYEDKAYSEADVVKLAKEKGIIIYGVGFPSTPDLRDMQTFSRMAEDTGGIYAASDFGHYEIPTVFIDQFFPYLENGGLIEIPTLTLKGKQSLSLTINLKDGTVISAQQDVTIPDPPVASPAPVPQSISFGERFEGILQNLPLYVWIIIFTLSLFITILFLIIIRRRRQKAQAASANQTSLPAFWQDKRLAIYGDPDKSVFMAPPVEEAALIAVLDVHIEEGFRRVDVRKRLFSFGRSEECDLVLNNDTVSRNHALLQLTKEGDFILTDLDSANGTFVNGEKVTTKKLKNSDILILGTEKITFHHPSFA